MSVDIDPAYFTHRDEAVWYQLLNNDEVPIGELKTVEDGKLDWSIYDTIRSAGSIEVADADAVDWLNVRIRPWYRLNKAFPGESLGIYLPTKPGGKKGGSGHVRTVELYDKLKILVDDKYDTTLVLDVGTNVTSAVRDIIIGAGEPSGSIAITESQEALATAMVWEVGTTKLRVINDLLDTINYFALWVDRSGTFSSSPYTAPSQRPESFNMVDNSESIYTDDFEDEQDSYDIPNMLICVSRSDGDDPAFVSIRTLDTLVTDSPYTIDRRGRRVVEYLSDIEATSQDTLDSICERKLLSYLKRSRVFKVPHAWLPLDLNAYGTFTNTESGIGPVTCTLTKFEFGLKTPGILMTSTLEEVTT